MEKRKSHFKNISTFLAITALLSFGTIARAQTTTNQNNNAVQNGTTTRDNDSTRDNDTTRRDLARFDQFLDSHREIAEQLRKDPSLVNNKQFVDNHPPLRAFLRDQPGISEEIKENPSAFMHQEDNFDRTSDRRGPEADRDEVARFNQFLDTHREIGEQLRKDPSLVDRRDFVENHPELRAYLQDHPGIRDQFKAHPNDFMHREENADRRYDDRDRDRYESFNKFLGDHEKIHNDLSKDPTLVAHRDYVENNPELRDYLKNNPDVNDQLMKNPRGFYNSTQQFSQQQPTGNPAATTTNPANTNPAPTRTPPVDAKPKI